MLLTWSFFVITAATPAVAQSAPAPKASGSSVVTAFVGVSVLPMDREQMLSRQTVLVRSDKIVEIGPAAQVKVPAGATRIDGTGKFLMPGLGDMHAHFFRPPESDELPDWYLEPRLVCYVANGVTSIRIMDPDTIFVEMQRVIAKRKLFGLHLSAVGTPQQRTTNGPQGRTFQEALAALRAAGYDFAQLEKQRSGQKKPESVATAVAQAGLRLTGDIDSSTSLDDALRTPYGSIEQLQGYPERLLSVKLTAWNASRPPTLVLDSLVRTAGTPPRVDEAQLAELVSATQRAGVWSVPVQSGAERMVELWSGKRAAASSAVLDVRRKLIKALHAAGAGLLVGTDAPTWGGHYGEAVHEELEAFVAVGLTPYQALETGTRNIGKFLGDSTGTVAAGQRANLVLLRANPLEDIRHTKQIAGVMVNGQWLSREKLDARLKANLCGAR